MTLDYDSILKELSKDNIGNTGKIDDIITAIQNQTRNINSIKEVGDLLFEIVQRLFSSTNLTILFYDSKYDFLPDKPVYRRFSDEIDVKQEKQNFVVNDELKRTQARFRISNSSTFSEVLIEGKPLFIEDIRGTELNEIEMKLYDQELVGSHYFYPLQFKDTIFGYVLCWKFRDNGKIKKNRFKFDLLNRVVENYMERFYFNYLQILTDINSRRFQQFIENSGDLILIMKNDGIIIDANKRLKSILGYSLEEVIGKTLVEIIHSEDYKEFYPEIKDGIDHIRFLDNENQERLLEVSFFKYVEFGKNHIYYWLARDQHERQHLLSQMIQNEKTKSLATLAGGIAHDFNNYLAAIEANATLLEYTIGESQNNELMEIINNIHQVVSNSQRLTHQLVTYSTGGQLKLSPVNLEAIVKDALEFSLSGADIISSCETSVGIPYVMGDEGMLTQVITNLIINARDALSSKNNKKIEVQIDKHRPDELVLSINDNGSGIEQTEINRIFDPFYSKKSKGTGLGLSTAKSIIKEHKGELLVESELGSYTKFSIILPQYQGELPEVAESHPNKAISGQNRIWIMDDVEDIRNSLEKLLFYNGQLVKSFSMGEAVLKELDKSQKDPDLLILDITNREGMGAYKLLEKLDNHNKSIPVIIMSGYAENLADQKFELCNHIIFMHKPLKEQELIASINKLLRR